MSEVAEDLLQLEKRLRDTLNSERAPVMGPCLEAIRSREPALLQNESFKAIREILRSGKDSIGTLLFCLKEWPVLTVLLVTEQVNQAYGEENEYAVHAAVERLLGSDAALSFANRKKVWRAFRGASYRIGLKVSSRESGVGYMIEEFLHQAGLPLAFVEKVTHAMAKTAREVGLPDEDDPEGVVRWQDCLIRHMKYLPLTAIRAIEADETGFYARVFLKVFSSGTASPTNTVEGIMTRILSQPRYREASGGWRQSLRIPRLLWRNDEFVLELPPGEELQWVVTVDGDSRTHRGEIAAEILPLMTVLPHSIHIASGAFANEYVVWEDEADNRFQILNADGQWLRSGVLGDAEIKLAPGDYSLVLRFQPQGMDEQCQCVSVEPGLFVMSLTLHPGAKCELRRGPAKAILAAESRPWIKLGGVRATACGEPIWICKALCLDVALGETESEPSTRNYVVQLSAEGKRIAQFRVFEGSVPVEQIVTSLTPGLHRVVAELCPEGTERAITRASALIWSGLEQQAENGVLHCYAWPLNLISSGCENTRLEREKGEIGPRDKQSPSFRTEFAGRNGRLTILDWAIPGVFMDLEDHSATPVLRRRFQSGAVLALLPQSRQLLRIRSTEDGQLRLDGKVVRELAHGRGASLHLSSLSERLATGSGVLQFESSTTGKLENIAQLVAPHQIFNFAQRRSPNQVSVSFQFALPCSEVRCQIRNLINGMSFHLNSVCDDTKSFSDKVLMRLESGDSQSGLHSYTLIVNTHSLSPGAWLFDLEVCLSGRWGAPTNCRQDTYCFGVLTLRAGETTETLEYVIGCCEEPTDPGPILDALTGVHQALQRCYAAECWQGLAWLKPLWKRWIGRLAPLTRVKTKRLLPLCEMLPPESSAVSWLPLQRIESALLELFAQPPSNYKGMEADLKGLGRSLSAISNLCDPLDHFPHEVIDPFVACGFGMARMMAGDAPSTFNFAEYCGALLSSPLPISWPPDWQPTSTQFLGRTHYQVAWERLRNRYRETMAGNDIRRQYCLSLCHAVARQHNSEAVLLHMLERKRNGGNFGDSLEDSFICEFEIFLSALAKECRMDVRRPGELMDYRQILTSLLPEGSCSLNDLLGYILQLGADMFGFYLILWEIVLVAKANVREQPTYA